MLLGVGHFLLLKQEGFCGTSIEKFEQAIQQENSC
jgi:hypothetical protein